jgi:3-oxoacyl-[acyl-carrier protein] reductase
MSGFPGLLHGKRVLIIGGGGDGIGGAITRAVGLAEAARVAIVSRTLNAAAASAARIKCDSCSTFALAADVLKADEVTSATRLAIDNLGGLDVLITVVGGYGLYVPWQSLESTPDEDWDLIFELNLKYVFRVLREALRAFTAQGTGGTVVSIGSIAAVMGTPMGAAYGASKAGLTSLARSVAAEYGRRGVRMNVINCGAIATPTMQLALKNGLTLEPVPIGRGGFPEEVGNLAVFLASGLAEYMNGQSLNFDGGATARSLFRLGNTDSSMACHCSTPNALGA